MAKQKRTPKARLQVTSEKKARCSTLPTPQKNPKALRHESFNSLHPSWRFSRLEMVDPFGWHRISTIKLHSLREKLQNFETMTWNNILVENKKNNHSVSINKLCNKAKKRLMKLRLDDIEELVSLRIQGIERVWGIRQQGTLLLLWWDPDHRVCPSLKKHT